MNHRQEETITIEKKYYNPFQEQRDNKNNFFMKFRKVVSSKAFIFFTVLFFVSFIISVCILKTHSNASNNHSSKNSDKMISMQNTSGIHSQPENSQINENKTEAPRLETSSSLKNTSPSHVQGSRRTEGSSIVQGSTPIITSPSSVQASNNTECPDLVPSSSPISTDSITSPSPNQISSKTEVPSPLPSLSPQKTDPITNPSQVQILYKIDQQWDVGATIRISIQNTGSTAIKSWNLAWNFTAGQQMKDSWGGSFHQNGSTITVQNLDWNKIITPGSSIQIGLNISNNGSNPVPSSIIFNGTKYDIK